MSLKCKLICNYIYAYLCTVTQRMPFKDLWMWLRLAEELCLSKLLQWKSKINWSIFSVLVYHKFFCSQTTQKIYFTNSPSKLQHIKLSQQFGSVSVKNKSTYIPNPEDTINHRETKSCTAWGGSSYTGNARTGRKEQKGKNKFTDKDLTSSFPPKISGYCHNMNETKSFSNKYWVNSNLRI